MSFRTTNQNSRTATIWEIESCPLLSTFAVSLVIASLSRKMCGFFLNLTESSPQCLFASKWFRSVDQYGRRWAIFKFFFSRYLISWTTEGVLQNCAMQSYGSTKFDPVRWPKRPYSGHLENGSTRLSGLYCKLVNSSKTTARIFSKLARLLRSDCVKRNQVPVCQPVWPPTAIIIFSLYRIT